MKKLVLTFGILTVCILSGCLSASDGIGVSKATRQEQREYFSLTGTQIEGLSFDTRNYLSGNLLYDQYRKEPELVLPQLFQKFRKSGDPLLLEVISDINYNRALQASSKEDQVRYALIADFGYYLLAFDPKYRRTLAGSRFSPAIMNAVIRYNICTAAVIRFFNEKDLLNNRSFEFSYPIGSRIVFQERPVCDLPLKKGEFHQWLLCSDFHPKNLFYFVQQFGAGVPMIADIRKQNIPGSLLYFEKKMTLPATGFIRFDYTPKLEKISARFEFYDSERVKTIDIHGEKIPLAADFTTPLAWEIERSQKVNLILMTRNADKLEKGKLIASEPYDPKKIPVVFIHGLLSSAMTWNQMLNILRSNETIREKYQFWYYQYSSGSPVFSSSAELRENMDKLRAKLVEKGVDVSNYDKMVLIGHSMGGLIARTFAVEGGDKPIRLFFNVTWPELKPKLTKEQIAIFEKYILMYPKPYVRRIVFMAVPHKGAAMATGLLAKLGSSLIRQSGALAEKTHTAMKEAVKHNKKSTENSIDLKKFEISTGVKDLKPDSRVLKALNNMPLSKKIVYHSIIGKQGNDSAPGGSDGIVPYSSSHIDEASSELIVKSSHSVQKHPKTIHELERILLLHLKECK